MKAIAASIAASLALASAPVQADTLRDDIAADMPRLSAIYRDLHANPELGMQEVRSAKIMADAARKAGFEVTEKVGGTGVVAVMRNGPGPTVLLRADMDGLPVTEQTGLAFASRKRTILEDGNESGVMHACGHDTHMTGWIGAAKFLAARKAEWSGTLLMIGQPAEEIGLGARAMLADGLYTRFPKPDYALAFHDAGSLPSGSIAVSSGWALANTDAVDIEIRGVGGHGAYPHQTKDAIVLASAIVMRLQTIVSREISAQDPTVITVGSFQAGTKHNIISDKALLQLTVRTYSDETRKHVLDAIARIAKGEAIAGGLPDNLMPVVTVRQPYTRSTWNSPDFAEQFSSHMREVFGKERVFPAPPAMAGEDFGEFRRADEANIKSLIFWVGGEKPENIAAARASGKPLAALHSPFWAPDAEAVIATGTEALVRTAMRLMPKTQ
jgi:amidohydrolase